MVVAFSSRVRILGECSTNHTPPWLFFFQVEIRSRSLLPLSMQRSVHSGSASWDDCGRVFHDELRVSSFPDWFPHYSCKAVFSAHSNFVGSKVYACLSGTCHLHFWQNDFGLLCGNTGMERTPNKSQHTTLTLEKKILPPLLPRFERATFGLRVRRSTNKLSRYR